MTLLLILSLLFGGWVRPNPDQDCGISGRLCWRVVVEMYLRDFRIPRWPPR